MEDLILGPPIIIRRASELIERRIRDAILDGKLKSGDRLSTEKKIAEQFGVSLVTIREALKALEVNGLIEKKKGQGGGIFVSAVGNNSIKASLGHFLRLKDLSPQHVYQVRKIIEPPSVRLAASKITLDELKRLEKNVSYCEEKIRNPGPLFTEKDFFDVDDVCIDFHRIITESASNPLLSLVLDYVLDFLVQYERKILVPDIRHSLDIVKGHRKILEYLKQGEAEECEKEMALDLERSDQYLKIRRGFEAQE